MLIHLMFGLVCNVFAFAFQGQGKYTNKSTEAEVGLGGRSTEQPERQQEAACADCFEKFGLVKCFQGQGKYTNNGTRAKEGRSTEQHMNDNRKQRA